MGEKLRARIMYIEARDGLTGPARIGRVTFSKTYKRERLEQAAVAAGEHRRDGDERVSAGDSVDGLAQARRWEAGDEVVGEVARVLTQLDDVHFGVRAEVG